MTHTHSPLATAVAIVVALAAIGYGGYRYYVLDRALAESKAHETALASQLDDTNASAGTLQEALNGERARNLELALRLGETSNSLGTLTKLSQTDPELLQKYSKVFFLSDNYVPASLTTIAPGYLSSAAKPLQFESEAYSFITNLMNDAQADGVDLKVLSAYRSFGTQTALKSAYKVTYGTGANAFSADQGYSEHQLGTAVDFTTSKLGGVVDSFAATPAYAWLLANGYKYGFELSYPSGNKYYQFEPWHWRFVGKSLAGYLHENRKNFYDLDQRTIDTYLVSVFDQ